MTGESAETGAGSQLGPALYLLDPGEGSGVCSAHENPAFWQRNHPPPAEPPAREAQDLLAKLDPSVLPTGPGGSLGTQATAHSGPRSFPMSAVGL